MKKESILDYFGQIWPETLGLIGSIILTIFFGDIKYWAIPLAITPMVVCFPIHHYIRKKKKNVMKEISKYQFVTNLNEIRKKAHHFPVDNEDNDLFANTIVDICKYVYDALANVDEKTKTIGYSKYCVVVSLLDDNLSLIPIYHDYHEMAKDYFDKLPDNIRLCDNSPYQEIYDSYINPPHLPQIKITSNVKKKVETGDYSTSFTSTKKVGIANLPYESSCILPILPFFNPRKGDEMQGFLAILSESSNVFPDNSDEINKELESLFESVSGYLYKVCTNNKSHE